ncbi:glycosyltransferase family 2 protein [Hyunsoonleella sp. 2307UL5-6]|uniref:glycosyltransferase family 2 protein n=1 Tax=Hyunsoonleella sp. 2307UL5-6 TaxID=3384768 RepID=UPI0039BC32A2
MNNKNKVSIITAVYNASEHLQDCINSVLNQTYQNWEHILVDDCSSDNSIQVIKEYINKDSRIKLITQSLNKGAGHARNKAIKASSGRFIAFLDCDDYWSTEKLTKQIDSMIKYNYPFSCAHYYEFEDTNGNIDTLVKCPKKITYNMLLKNGGYVGCLTVVYDTKRFGKRYMPEIRKRQDWALWLKMLKEIDFAYGIQEPLAYYRRGNASLSKNKIKLIKHNFNVYKNELNMSYLESTYRMTMFLYYHFFLKPFSRKKL